MHSRQPCSLRHRELSTIPGQLHRAISCSRRRACTVMAQDVVIRSTADRATQHSHRRATPGTSPGPRRGGLLIEAPSTVDVPRQCPHIGMPQASLLGEQTLLSCTPPATPPPATSCALPEPSIPEQPPASTMPLGTRGLLALLPLSQTDIARLDAHTWPPQPAGTTEPTEDRISAQSSECFGITHRRIFLNRKKKTKATSYTRLAGYARRFAAKSLSGVTALGFGLSRSLSEKAYRQARAPPQRLPSETPLA